MKISKKNVLKNKIKNNFNDFCNFLFRFSQKYKKYYISICPLAKEVCEEYKKEIQQKELEK